MNSPCVFLTDKHHYKSGNRCYKSEGRSSGCPVCWNKPDSGSLVVCSATQGPDFKNREVFALENMQALEN